MAKSDQTASESYQQLTSELDDILSELQREDVDIDDALEHYKRGLELVQKLDGYLKAAENTVTELKAKFSLDA